MTYYFKMGHAETLAGWMFNEGSWGVRGDGGDIVGVFPTEQEAWECAMGLEERDHTKVEKLNT